MARLKSDRIIGTAPCWRRSRARASAPWLACGVAILMATIVVPAIALGLLLRAINRAPAERHPPRRPPGRWPKLPGSSSGGRRGARRPPWRLGGDEPPPVIRSSRMATRKPKVAPSCPSRRPDSRRGRHRGGGAGGSGRGAAARAAKAARRCRSTSSRSSRGSAGRRSPRSRRARPTPRSASCGRSPRVSGSRISDLMGEARTGLSVLRRGEAQLLRSADGRFDSRPLMPAAGIPQVEMYELRLAARSRHASEPHGPGTREIVVVLFGLDEDDGRKPQRRTRPRRRDGLRRQQAPRLRKLGGAEARCHNVIVYGR